MRLARRHAAAVAVVCSIASGSALAFDSAGPETGNMSRARPAYLPAPQDPFILNNSCSAIDYPVPNFDELSCSTTTAIAHDRCNYTAKILHYASANAVAGTVDTMGSNTGVLSCPRSTTADVPPADLSGCNSTPFGVSQDDLIGPFGGDVGWAKIRRAWDSPAATRAWGKFHSPEHMLITQAAASLAGFDKTPLFKQPFWARYPTLNRFVVSPLDNRTYAAGATYIPARLAMAQAHARRAIFLPELAQMPDASYTVWDWAAGNEICPIENLDAPGGGIHNAFSSAGETKYDVNNCHDYAHLLGPLNASHFKPNSKAYWTYYHSLARQRMSECIALDGALGPIHYNSTNIVADDPSRFETEEQECEREAMVFEMFAQHFLQDNWATGHMWARWGAPDLRSIPTDFPAAVPGQNDLARQTIQAQLLAMAAGTIHGTKAVSQALLPLALSPLADDPLSAPFYPDLWSNVLYPIASAIVPPAAVQWTDGTMVAHGAGDYFWSPPQSFGKIGVAYTSGYEEQRNRLLACAAKSMREVYVAGPQRHGALASTTPPAAGVSIDGVEPSSDYCWANWATNSSMAGSLESLFLSRNWFGPLSPALVPLANYITAAKWTTNTAQQIAFSGYGLHWLEAVDAMLSDQWVSDTLLMQTDFNLQAIFNGGGTESARLVAPLGRPITMLGVSPNYLMPPTDVAGTLQPPSYYSDMPAPRDEAQHPSDYYLRRMFWRSHLRETCSEVDMPALLALQQRCVGATATGGDPDACTACVEAAEPHVPVCGAQSFTLSESKCQALGTDIKGALPQDWFDSAVRWNANGPGSCLQPDGVALEFCTGMVGATTAAGGGVSTNTAADPNDVVLSVNRGILSSTLGVCSVKVPTPDEPNPAKATLRTVKYRVAVAHSEGDSTLPTHDILVSSFDSTTTDGERALAATECQEVVTDTSEQSSGLRSLQAADGSPGFPLGWDIEHRGTAWGLGINYCGATRRVTTWNRSCADVLSHFPWLGVGGEGIDLSAAPGLANVTSTGWAYQQGSFYVDQNGNQYPIDAVPPPNSTLENRCILVEPVHYSRTCQAGQSCGASDLCVPGGAGPSINYLSEW